jgi:hypothetical protein
MKYLQHFKIFEKLVDKILYHGGLEGFYDEETKKNMFNRFKKFAPRTAYFSENPRFALDYADRKTSEGGYDADIWLYKCKFKGNLFEHDSPEDMNKLIPLIPDEIDVSHGIMWFMSRKVKRDEMIKALQGIAVIEPRPEFANANIGDKVPNPFYKSENFIVVKKDDNYVWTISEQNYRYHLRASEKGYDKHFSEHAKLRDIFTKWRNAIVDVYNENTGLNMKYPETKYGYGDDETSVFYRLMITYLQARTKLKGMDYTFRSKGGQFTLTQEQVDHIEKLHEEAVKEFDEKIKDELHNTKWNRHVEEEKLESNWTYYENDTIQHLIEKLGYDGYVALEDKVKTFAIYHPDKTVEIIESERMR